ncbi:VacJ family lipoprotein [Tropicimonas sp. TH_r6]|uniref:MlaA family lipoprotein n=1 Tax=Tropicimonas sp. TH_r6 TaxID=3082085 RepID=UPI002953239F|nr:VacJ family lipoprotein [Tropicimonas sp. TH_r6]MDV7144125.1 VacJ family lipoprotein [Tropicimonas sp. TH_r6]
MIDVLTNRLPRGEKLVSLSGALALTLGLVSCGPANIPSDINDPNEIANRRTHEFNKSLDRALGGGSDSQTSAMDDSEALDGDEDALSAAPVELDAAAGEVSPLLIAVANFGTNLDTPRKIVNSLLQVRPGDAAHNTLRFGINSTIGVFGIMDVARAAGLPEVDTDFGETLHVWGVPEGHYQELPIVGPSTQRDTAGRTVDFVMNPLWYVFPWPQNLVANGFTWAEEATDRIRYGETVNSILYESEDSYAQSRLIYLQNRRFEMSRGDLAENDESLDLFEEFYGD